MEIDSLAGLYGHRSPFCRRVAVDDKVGIARCGNGKEIGKFDPYAIGKEIGKYAI